MSEELTSRAYLGRLWLLMLTVFGDMMGFLIVLPLLPTTPLVLLSAFCFGKGSPRLRAWIHDHAHFGPMIAHWRETGAITRRAKCMAVIAMGAALALSLAMGLAGWLIAVQVICLAGAATFILTRPSA